MNNPRYAHAYTPRESDGKCMAEVGGIGIICGGIKEAQEHLRWEVRLLREKRANDPLGLLAKRLNVEEELLRDAILQVIREQWGKGTDWRQWENSSF